MKKLDLHIHTKPALYEKHFDFDIDVLKKHINDNSLDIIAITNHNLFDLDNYNLIKNTLSIKVYAGVEIDIEKGHLLLIVDDDLVYDLNLACSKLSNLIKNENDYISFEQFVDLFPFYKNTINIPHIEKKPRIQETTKKKFGQYIVCGEVGSAKKFEIALKDDSKLPPVYFSDLRMGMEYVNNYRFTYLDIESVDYSVIKSNLSDKNKLFLNYVKARSLFEINKDKDLASTGLNVIMGKRSSGKTTLLDKIAESNLNCKYIKQFALTGNSEKERFQQISNNFLNEEKKKFLSPLKSVVEKIITIEDNSLDVIGEYLSSLKEYASNQALNDEFSKTKMFTETFYYANNPNKTKEVIKSLDTVISYDENNDIVNKYVLMDNLIKLLNELIEVRKREYLDYLLKKETDEITKFIQEKLKQKSSMKPIKQCNFSELYVNKKIIESFNTMAVYMKTNEVICSSDVFGYKLELRKNKYKSTTELKKGMGVNGSLSNEYALYDANDIFNFVKKTNNNNFTIDQIMNGLMKIDVIVLNSNGNELSGGERAEFNLLKELKDSESFDVLLLDEPEASFDNPFINERVCNIIKNLSLKTTVFITTHNNTLGMLMQPDRIIYTYHENDKYDLFSGEFGSKVLKNSENNELIAYNQIISVMEAGHEAYERRRCIYENIKN